MKHSILWLSLSACVRVIARPVSYSNYILTDTNTDYVSTGTSTWPSNTNDPLDSPSQYNSFTVAEQPEPQNPSPPSRTLEQLKLRLTRLLIDVYNGKYKDIVTDDLPEILDETTQEYLDKKLAAILNRPRSKKSMSLAEELIEYLGRTEGPSEPEQGPSSDATGDPSTPRKGGTADPTNQNPSAFQGLTPTDTAHPIPGLTKENLIKFLTVVVNIAPEIDVGLKGIDLSWAVLEAVPGFLRTLWGNWLPAGL